MQSNVKNEYMRNVNVKNQNICECMNECNNEYMGNVNVKNEYMGKY